MSSYCQRIIAATFGVMAFPPLAKYQQPETLTRNKNETSTDCRTCTVGNICTYIAHQRRKKTPDGWNECCV